jgi:hypothetical protein
MLLILSYGSRFLKLIKVYPTLTPAKGNVISFVIWVKVIETKNRPILVVRPYLLTLSKQHEEIGDGVVRVFYDTN